MSAPPSAKRLRPRAACEPCRRKKTKCDGGRPACAFCARLGQACVYGTDETIYHSSPSPARSLASVPASGAGTSQPLADRVQMLEAKLAEVLGVVNQQQPRDHNAGFSPSASTNISPFPISGRQSTQLSTSVLPSWEVIIAATEKYLLYCECQPLPLFHRESLVENIKSREPELIYAILALSLRFSDDGFLRSNNVELTNGFAETARMLAMRRVSEGPIELSTLQSLCILSLIEFTNGNRHRASIHSSLAMNLAYCAGLATQSQMSLPEIIDIERRGCFWSIILLKHLHGPDITDLDFSGEENLTEYPESIPAPTQRQDARRLSSSVSEAEPRNEIQDAGIVAYGIQLSEVWFKTTRYARRRGAPSKLPPWSPKSEYAIIVAEQMDFETRMPYKHRFRPAGFSQRPIEELQLNRSYWGPWLFNQFLYHTNLCLLNHPLILALRLRNFRGVIPEIFLQHTSDLVSSHTSWIIHLISMVQAKSFKVTDPFLGHCAAIVATIYLQESFVEAPEVRQEKQTHFAKCLEFIRAFGQEWPHISRLADKLQQLQNTVSASYHHRSSNSQGPTRSLLIDLARFWEILEYSSASEVYESARRLFGSSLYSGSHQSPTEVFSTSTLPPPTRLGSATQDAELRTPQPSGDLLGHDVATNFARASFPMENFSNSSFIEAPYSNDELAILAESFFNQRQEFGGNTGDWWNTGNL